MKLALIGDLHLHERSPRYAHVLEVLDWTIDDALARGASSFALLGDLFEAQASGSEYAALLDRVHRMRARGPVIVILGNHEAPTSLAFWHHLGVLVAWDRVVRLHHEGATILAIPYPRRGRPPFHDLDGETIGDTMQSAAQRISEEIAAEREATETGAPGTPLIVLGHWTIEGMGAGASEFEVHSATEVVVPRAALEGAALVAVGHIHSPQDWHPDMTSGWDHTDEMHDEDHRLLGVGSLIRHSFAEADDEKSYTLVTVEQGRVTWERRPVPARAMLVETMDWQAGDAANAVAANLLAMQAHGKEVRLTVQITEDRLGTFAPRVFNPIREVAAHFVLERVTVSPERVRAPRLVRASSLKDQFLAWAEATSLDLPDGRRLRALEKVAEVEG